MSAAESVVSESVREASKGQFIEAPAEAVYVLDGFNPRKHFEQSELDELADSIQKDGLIQPIVVRERPCEQGQYHLVAGERRFRAICQLGWSSIPAMVRPLSDEQARIVAVAENSKRRDIGPGEEALVARDVLDACQGDREVAAKEIGWSRSKLDSRLLLLKATPKVIDALNGRKIKIAHAELLAGLPHVTQDGTVDKIIEGNITPAQLKDRIATVTIELSSAVFDRTECNGCPHNTQTQRGLFESALDGEKCQNRECFTAKTKAHLSVVKDQLAEDYPKAALASEADMSTVTLLIQDGDNGVGQEQYKQGCAGCQYRGALINDQLDGKTGKVNRSICFNSACNTEKREAYRKQFVVQTDENNQSSVQAVSASAPATTNTTPTKSPAKPAAAATPRKVIAQVNGQLSAQAVEAVGRNEALALGIEAMVHSVKTASQCSKATPEETQALKTAKESSLQQLSALGTEALIDLQHQLAKLALRGQSYCESGFGDEPTSNQIKRWKNVAPEATLTVDEALIDAMTSSSAQAMFDEIGLFTWLEKQDKGAEAVKAIKGAKKKELAKTVMAHEGFDFTGHLPTFAKPILRGKASK